ncbi:LysR family transcriptional regulator [Vibrio panuliri]|uniref:LysR family transcriptional regulator n=1 Tax=Vibrio panuliri TaxID=1381081 RepID=A0A1Q9HQF5_9VIBR|nr:LysR family transcriptional regulator [Vibrio panuliri]KAB1457986.1 LysR family transcriptional regulator [Vibrio panuliri]OLQ89613.1 LysR family transcriptional regulator [Vibrio panuliri]OLQ93107.1 LysR family transcriptional regulator [Vibrio panuliri]
MLNPLWLKTFVTLIETGHFTRTAEKLFMTQPGVSQHIKKLEAECGYPLIERNNKSFDITTQGQAVYDYAREMQLRETQLLTNLEPDSPYKGTVKIACSGSLALLLYPDLLELQCQHPALISHVEAAPKRKVLADVLSGEADIGIVTSIPTDKRLVSQQLSVEPLCLMLPASHPSDNLSIDQLQQLGMINHPDAENCLALYCENCHEEWLQDLRFDQIPITGYVNQLSQILLPVSKGLGFTVLPQGALENFPEKEKIVVYQAKQEVAETLYLITKQRARRPLRFTTIINQIENILSR